VFPLELSRDILSFPGLGSSGLVLYDIDVAAAERTRTFVEQLIDLGAPDARVRVCRRLSDHRPTQRVRP
jgi:alpha-galactosidase/6-phospho-beta-glucosidase family protein